MSEIAFPQKKAEFNNHHFDSAAWNDFKFRDDDVVVSTYAKSGTTWTQQIISQLIFDDDEQRDMISFSTWLDLRIQPRQERLDAVEAQVGRRFMKTHLPIEALVYSPKAKYVYVARDGRDVCWSLHNHHVCANEIWYQAVNETPGLVGPPVPRPVEDVREYFLTWLEQDGYPFWPFWSHIRGWWSFRHLPNLLLVNFADLKADPQGEIRRIADFLGIEVEASRWPTILERCSFAYMKENASKVASAADVMFEGGATNFINKGRNGRWRDVLTAQDCRVYEETAQRELGEACAAWLAEGRLADR